MKKRTTFQDYNIEDIVNYKGYTYKVVDRSKLITFCVRVPGDGIKYGFLNNVVVSYG